MPTKAKSGRQLDREIDDALGRVGSRRVRVFHGTKRSDLIIRNGFLPSTGGEFGPGIYFSENVDTAVFYATHVARGEESPTIVTTTLDISKFFEIRKVDWIKKTQTRSPRTVQAALKRQGHTGIIGIAINDYERQLVAFDATSIVGPVSIYKAL